MPVVESLMRELVAKYGKERGTRIYYAMEASGKGPFAAGAKYRGLHEDFAAKHGVKPVSTARKKKPASRRGVKKRRK